MSKITVNLFFDKRASKEGEGIIKWLVCQERKQRLFSTGRKVKAAEWKFLQENKNRLDNRIKDENKIQLWHEMYGNTFQNVLSGNEETSYLKRAQIIIAQLNDNFTFEAFAEATANYGKPQQKQAEQNDMIEALLTKAAAMYKDNRVGNGDSYKHAAKSLCRFIDSFTDEERKEFLNIPIPRKRVMTHVSPILRFEHLTPEFLNTYEQWMLQYGKAPKSPKKPPTPANMTTVGIYLRHVRAVVNDAIEAGIMSRDDYSFSRNRYVIPAGSNIKKALSREHIDKIKGYKPTPGTMEQRSHDLWLFSYFCNGANMTDICRLTWSQIDFIEAKILFVRQKTARSKKQNQIKIVAHLRSETLAVIERWGTSEKLPGSYVFPFLNTSMTEKQKKLTVQQVVKMTNKWVNKIAIELGIDADVNTYAARHSFATILLKSKAPLSFISKSLGHTNLKTTESYFGSFDDDEAKKFLSAL